MLHLSSKKPSFRLMAVIRMRMWWTTGTIHATNSMLAEDAGGCDERTIRREIAFLRKAGFIITEEGGRKDKAGQPTKTRTMKLSFPNSAASKAGPRVSALDGVAPGPHVPAPPGHMWSHISCTPEQEEPTDDLF